MQNDRCNVHCMSMSHARIPRSHTIVCRTNLKQSPSYDFFCFARISACDAMRGGMGMMTRASGELALAGLLRIFGACVVFIIILFFFRGNRDDMV